MQNIFKNAIDAYNAGNYTSALDYFNQAISLDSNSAFAYNGRGNIYNALQDSSSAINDYTRAISLKPNFPDAYYNRGIVHAKLKNYPSALSDYTQAITIDPKYINAYSYRGLIYKEIGDLVSAIRDYSHAISLNPNLLEAYHNRSHAYFLLGDSKNALSDAEKEADLGNGSWLQLLKEMIDTDARIKSTDHDINQIGDVVMEKNALGLLIKQDGIDEVSKELAKSIIADTIPSQKIARQFILEELDAASGGNEETERFILKSGIPKSEYEGAMFRSFEEVDGPDGPQAILNKIPLLIDDRDLAMRFRIKVVELIMKHFGIGDQQDNFYNIEKTYSNDNNTSLNDRYLETISGDQRVLSVVLTEMSLLRSFERSKRAQLYEVEWQTELQLVHDKFNEHDDKAIEVHYDGVYIGFIRKRFKDENKDYTSIVENFCFINNKLCDDLQLAWEGYDGKFNLYRKSQQALYQAEQEHKRILIEQQKAEEARKPLQLIEDQKNAKIQYFMDEIAKRHREYNEYWSRQSFFYKLLTLANDNSGMGYGNRILRDNIIKICNDNIEILKRQKFGIFNTSALSYPNISSLSSMELGWLSVPMGNSNELLGGVKKAEYKNPFI